jgi:uncharacterized damage-inducible protein DinB
MSIAQSLLPELEHEAATTRTLLALCPADRTSWKPHPKSFSLGDLGTHLANLPRWCSMTIAMPELDVAPADGPAFPPPVFTSIPDMLATFDANVASAREALAGATDAQLMEPWTLKKTGVTIFTLPKAACLRSFVLNHMIHHRGQLDVYLRLCDVPLPQVYGPTADAPM